MIYRAGNRIDTNSCQKLSDDLAKILANGEDVILDLAETTYISSAGLRSILIALKTFRAKGYDFSVINPNDFVMSIFKTTGLTNILLINQTVKGSKGK